MRFKKIYLEITNVCNLNCKFCPKTKRKAKNININEYNYILSKIRPFSDYLYLHVMGEPLMHPNLEEFLKIAYDYDFKVILTTNGTLINQKKEILLSSKALHKINISLHAYEANDFNKTIDQYLEDCITFAKNNNGNKIIVFRLWNNGGYNNLNEIIISKLKSYFDFELIEEHKSNKIFDNTYLEFGDKFEWPDLKLDVCGENGFCYGLRDQIAILSDGTVVPCCLDHEGDIKLGNIFSDDLSSIINSERALNIYNGFTNRKVIEELCKKCQYKKRFK